MLSAILTTLLIPFPVFCNTVGLSGDSAVYIGGTAEYIANSPTSGIPIINITWTLNGSLLDQLTDISSNTLRLANRNRQLVLTNIPITYDNTEVQCTVILDNSADNVSCGPAIQLRVQGLLGPVVNLTSEYNAATSNLNISWSPPAALTVPPATTPERFYCVQVMYGEMMESRGCDGSMNEETSYLLQNVGCGVNYTIAIVPVNRVGNGTESSVLLPATFEVCDLNISPGMSTGTSQGTSASPSAVDDNIGAIVGGLAAAIIIVLTSIALLVMILLIHKRRKKVKEVETTPNECYGLVSLNHGNPVLPSHDFTESIGQYEVVQLNSDVAVKEITFSQSYEVPMPQPYEVPMAQSHKVPISTQPV